MSRELTGLSYVVLNLIGRNGAGPHDLVRMARAGQRLYWAGAESKIYAQPKLLEQDMARVQKLWDQAWQKASSAKGR